MLPSELKRKLEAKRAVAQFRIAHEQDKPDPDILKLDRYGKELAEVSGQLMELDKRMALFSHYGETRKSELAYFSTLLARDGSLSRKGILGKMKFKDALDEDLFLEYAVATKRARLSRKYFFFGEEIYEKA